MMIGAVGGLELAHSYWEMRVRPCRDLPGSWMVQLLQTSVQDSSDWGLVQLFVYEILV